mmetsp:Transcript_46550/g.120486  ORF Transcript_46550/g.120486 Transcript_46550/m.120486 type:complete len:219 (-) Transcript_46550:1464-2120(-)
MLPKRSVLLQRRTWRATSESSRSSRSGTARSSVWGALDFGTLSVLSSTARLLRACGSLSLAGARQCSGYQAWQRGLTRSSALQRCYWKRWQSGVRCGWPPRASGRPQLHGRGSVPWLHCGHGRQRWCPRGMKRQCVRSTRSQLPRRHLHSTCSARTCVRFARGGDARALRPLMPGRLHDCLRHSQHGCEMSCWRSDAGKTCRRPRSAQGVRSPLRLPQ